ncbi:mitochondrial import inner membrane translocase subunit Tim9 isoform X2 [Hemicordylus capensis]|uniref:mitochondrial import inner membrane translocase subunit Tim9 isoform X2 n=1 Tax=Hemicordylus capensis TaxID=884348 RepID=UPI0023030F51|nr:mitochondrial import inner membrane translocase subunit Tim9 isoform X2 [Hemicordylus capensis]
MAGQISESDQIKQFKEFLGTYNKLTETCFLDCVKDFTSREVKPDELQVKHILRADALHAILSISTKDMLSRELQLQVL